MKSDPTSVVAVRAVDIGYFNTKLTLGRKIVGNTSGLATMMFPSLAPRMPAGLNPTTLLQSNPSGCVVEIGSEQYFVGRDSILHTAGREPREVLQDYCQTEKYLALLRGALHYMFDDFCARDELVIRHLVLGLPLNNFALHREQLTSVARGEHLLSSTHTPGSRRRVTVERVSVVVQPQGAMLNHHNLNPGSTASSGWMLVVDVGGGTLDWFVARQSQPSWTRSGAYPKSMLAISYAVADKIDPTWRDNIEIIERIDRAIRTSQPTFRASGTVYEMSSFENVIQSVLKESVDKMVSTVGSFADLDTILFTGGGAGVFKDYFVGRFPKLKSSIAVDPDPIFSNVRGFHIAGDMIDAQRAR